MHAAAQAGRARAAADYGLEKNAAGLGGVFGGGAKWLGRGAKVLGALPTGIGNIAAAGIGALSGVVGSRAQGHGWGHSLASGALGAMSGIPGVGGVAAQAGSMALDNFHPPPPPPVGSMITG